MLFSSTLAMTSSGTLMGTCVKTRLPGLRGLRFLRLQLLRHGLAVGQDLESRFYTPWSSPEALPSHAAPVQAAIAW